MVFKKKNRHVKILLIEDNRGDIRLIEELIKGSKIINSLQVAEDSIEALAYLRNQGKFKDELLPDLIILNLNLPKKDGLEVLAVIKEDKSFKHIPVIIFTTSKAEMDVIKSYALHANCYITKPTDMSQFIKILKKIEYFWFNTATLPPNKSFV